MHEFKSSITSSLNPIPSDLQLQVSQYTTVLKTLLDRFAPKRERFVTLRPHAPWFNESLRSAKVVKRRLERKWRSSRLEVDRQVYRDYCANYQRLLCEFKSSYHKMRLDGLDQKDLFKEMDKLVNGKHVPKLPSNIPIDSLPDSFGDFFKDKVDELRSNITHSDPIIFPESVSNACMSDFSLLEQDVVRGILLMSPSKSCSLDPIPTSVLKDCLEVLLPSITSIINGSLSQGVVPDDFKSALVTPLLKKANLDPDILSHYRPISNLSFLSKVLERAVLPQLLSHLQVNDLLPRLQSAYRSGHSTETALLRVQNDLLRTLDDGNEAFLVLLDFSAAFDTIDHRILLDRLSSRFGFRGTVLSWLSSYLSNRVQRISINGRTSQPYSMDHGVPQGSVLGPFLFTLYIAPLEDIFERHGISAMTYADDTQLYIVIDKHHPGIARAAIERCIADIKTWCAINKLVLNDVKTDFIHVHSKFSRTVSEISEISVGSSIITPKHEVRNLGVIFNDQLSLQSHINHCCKLSFLALSNIYKVRKYLDRCQAERLIHAFVTNRIDHCNSLYLGLPKIYLDKLQRVLNAAAKVVIRPGVNDSTRDILRSLHWLPVKERIIYKILLMTYKARNGLAPTYLSSLLHDYVQSRSLRSSSKGLLTVPRTKTKTFGDRSFSVAAPELWNTLPIDIKLSASVDIFKSKLKTFLFKQAYL